MKGLLTLSMCSRVVLPALSRPRKRSLACLLSSPNDARTSQNHLNNVSIFKENQRRVYCTMNIIMIFELTWRRRWWWWWCRDSGWWTLSRSDQKWFSPHRPIKTSHTHFLLWPVGPCALPFSSVSCTDMIYSLLIINKAGGLIYNREYNEGTSRLSSNDYLVLAGTFHGYHPISQRARLTLCF